MTKLARSLAKQLYASLFSYNFFARIMGGCESIIEAREGVETVSVDANSVSQL